jgi:hypothetical protein
MGGLAADYGPGISCLHPWAGGLLAGGEFGSVNQVTRESIFMVDSTGALTSAFDGFQVGVYAGQFGNSAEITSIVEHTSDTLFICGAYIGLNDGTTNDPQQRFVSRLLVSELTTGVVEQTPPQASLQLWPNPSAGQVWLAYALPGHSGPVQMRIRDAQGRIAHSMQASGEEGQVVWGTRNVAPGVYTVELLRDGKLERTERSVIQP